MTIPEHTQHVLNTLTTHARPLILEHFTPDSCIAATRITINTLNYFNIPTTPTPVTAYIFNPEAVHLYTTDPTNAPTIINNTNPHTPGGPWSIGLGLGQQQRPHDNQGWAGHLITTIPDHHIAIDLTLDQANRPHKNMTYPPTWYTIPDPQWWEPNPQPTELTHPNGSRIILTHNTLDPHGYKTSPNWTMTGACRQPMKNIIGQLIRIIRDETT